MGGEETRPFVALGTAAALLDHAWWLIVAVAATAIQATAIGRVFGPVEEGTHPPMGDSVIFEYIGWYVSRGARLYVDVWEIKPPLPFELTTILAVLAGGDPVALHRLAVAATCAAVVGCAVVIAALVRAVTNDDLAAVAAGLTPFVLPAFHLRAAVGFKDKYFVVLFGLLAIYLAVRERPLLAGGAAAAAAWSWQFAAIFPVLVVGLSMQSREWEAVARTVAGLLAVSALVLAPIIVWGAVPEMVAETVLAPLLVPEGKDAVYRLHLTVRLFDAALPAFLLGVYGIVRSLASPLRTRLWWLPAGGAWFAGQVLFVDLDTYPDLFVLLAFAAVGGGVLVGTVGSPDRRLLAGLLAVSVVGSVVTMGGLGVGFDRVAVPDPNPVYDGPISVPYNNTEETALFWRAETPETCRVFAGKNQAVVVEKIDGEIDARVCGDFEASLAAVLNRSNGTSRPTRVAPVPGGSPHP